MRPILLWIVILPWVPLLVWSCVNTLVVGETQQGKTTLVLLEDILPTIDAASHAVFVYDPHDSLADKVARYCTTMGHGHRLTLDDLGETRHVASPGILQRSLSRDPEEREYEHEMAADAFLEVLASQRKDYNVHDRTNTKRYCLFALRAWLDNDADLPLWMLPYALMPPIGKNHDSPFYDRILSGIRDPKTRYEIGRLKGFSFKALDETVGASLRLIDETFENKPFKYRMEASFDLARFIENKGIYCVKGGRASDATKRTMMRLIQMRVSRHVLAHWFASETHETPLPVKHYIDEAANFGLIGRQEASAMAQTTKMGETRTIITQVPRFGDDAVDELMFGNTPRKIVLKCWNPTSRTMADQMRANLDPMKEHFRDSIERQRHAGMEIVERRSRQRSEDRLTDIVGEAHVPVYETYIDQQVHYLPLQSQDMLNESEIQRLTKGNCLIVSGGQIYRHQFSDWSDPGVIAGFSDECLAERIEELKREGTLRTPTRIEFDRWIAPPHTSAEPSEKARTRKVPKGMIG